jgi:hypothetical protein
MLFKTYVLGQMNLVFPCNVLVYLKIDRAIRVELLRLCKYVGGLFL